MKLLRKLRAARQCRISGHQWSSDGTLFDYDGGYGGGKDLYVYRCSRCGKRKVAPWPMDDDKHKGRKAGKDNETCMT